jgi:hypothetical protein
VGQRDSYAYLVGQDERLSKPVQHHRGNQIFGRGALMLIPSPNYRQGCVQDKTHRTSIRESYGNTFNSSARCLQTSHACLFVTADPHCAQPVCCCVGVPAHSVALYGIQSTASSLTHIVSKPTWIRGDEAWSARARGEEGRGGFRKPGDQPASTAVWNGTSARTSISTSAVVRWK